MSKAGFFIFYRDSSEPNILERFIDNSSYSNQMLLNDNKSNNSEINPLKIMKKISKFNSDSINFYYGIRINESIAGLMKMAVSDEMICFTYSAESYAKANKAGFISNEILCFNWKGGKIKKYLF